MLRRPALFALLVLLAGVTGAHAEDRCTGTFCDFYYGGPPAETSKPAPQAPAPAATNAQLPLGATPITVPRFFAPHQTNADGTPAPVDQTPSRFNIGGGGLIGRLNGETPERCTGTLCDLYYGGPPEEKSATPTAAGSTTATAVVDDEPAPQPYREGPDTVRRAPPSCAAKGRDPWSCYR